MSAESFREALQRRVILADGAMGTLLYSKGVYINQSFDGVTLSNPALVSEVHREYLQAGAELLETNTFSANRLSLQKFGLAERVSELNETAARLAREAIAEARVPAWVAGSLGTLDRPLQPHGDVTTEEARSIYLEQVIALNTGGVDLFCIETIPSTAMLALIVDVVRSISDKPIIAHLTINDEFRTPVGESMDAISDALNRLNADAVGFNCSIGPQPMLEWIEQIRPKLKKPVSVMPNAGTPILYEGRHLYLASPEYLATFTKHFIEKGVSIVGGCCGTTPAHIRLMRNAARSVVPRSEQLPVRTPEVSTESVSSVEFIPKEERSRLARRLSERKFTVSVEIDPPRGTRIQSVLAAARKLHEAGIDIINIADGPRASARMCPMALATLFEREVGIETLIHYCCRDRNVLGMQSDLLGAHALGLRNILLITGDPPKLGDYPYATGVFDLDAIGLTQMARNLNRGVDIIGNPIGKPTAFVIAVGANPSALNFDREIARLEKKIEAGAELILTQPVYDADTFERFHRAIEQLHTPVWIGICPLASARNAEFIHNEIPGMSIPDGIRKRMSEPKTAAAQQEEGVAIAREALSLFKPLVQGTYLMPPLGKYELALDVLRGIL